MNSMPNSGPKGIVIHHSAGKDGPGVDREEIRRIHVQDNGWDDIGYHFLIEEENGWDKIFTGRLVQYTGAHCPGANDYIGICVVGNFHSTPPSQDKINKLFSLVKGLMLTYQIKPENIHPHRKFKRTECPGDAFPWESFWARCDFFYKSVKGYY